ncbi:MAG: hypothetical protein Q9191_007270, partial [Dirinaria sp. TL-2023a]
MVTTTKGSEDRQCARCREADQECQPRDADYVKCQRCFAEHEECSFENSDREDDSLILVIGPTGAGKTTFIGRCIDSIMLERSHGSEPKTRGSEEAIASWGGHNIDLIDTPGFGATNHPDADILIELASFLADAYKQRITVTAVVYLYPISSHRIRRSDVRTLKILAELIGNESVPKIILATTKWDTGDTALYEQREKDLHTRFWGQFLAKGCMTFRLDGRRESALRILNAVIARKPADSARETKASLQIQRELVDQSKLLVDTSAGQLLTSLILELIEKREKELEELTADFKSSVKDNKSRSASVLERESKLQKELTRLLREQKATQVAMQVDCQTMLAEATKENTRLQDLMMKEAEDKFRLAGQRRKRYIENSLKVVKIGTKQPNRDTPALTLNQRSREHEIQKQSSS